MASEDALANGQTKDTPVEATDGFPTVNSTLTKGNFVYQLDVKENSAAGWASRSPIRFVPWGQTSTMAEDVCGSYAGTVSPCLENISEITSW